MRYLIRSLSVLSLALAVVVAAEGAARPVLRAVKPARAKAAKPTHVKTTSPVHRGKAAKGKPRPPASNEVEAGVPLPVKE